MAKKVTVKKSTNKKKKSIKKKIVKKKAGKVVKKKSTKKTAYKHKNIRECVIYNMDTGKYKKCQYNPEDLPRSRSATYATITSPGMAYPLIQFVSGDVEDMEIKLLFYNRKNPSAITSFDKFLDELLPPKHNKSGFRRPPMFKFYYGHFVDTFVLVKKSIEEEMLDTSGNPFLVKYTLSARRV